MASQSSIDTIQKAYITYYGRPADQNGLEYWADQLDTAQGELSSVIDAFGTSLEFTERFSELDNEALINNIYQQAFSRDADEGGTDFYLERLESGEATLASIALQILDGAQNEDVLVLQKKIEVGDLVVHQAQEEGRVYTGSAVATAVSELLSEVTLDSPDVQQHAEAFDEITGKMAYSQNSYQPEALEEGYLVREEQDLDRDGFVEIIKTSTYDDLGRLIRTDEDTDGDGSTDQVFQWQYDEFSNLSRYEVDTDADGQADYISTSVYKEVSVLEANEAYQLAVENYQEAYEAYWEAIGDTEYSDFSERSFISRLPAEHTEAQQEVYEIYRVAFDAVSEARQSAIQEYEDFHITFNLDAPSDAPESPSSVIPTDVPEYESNDSLDHINLVSHTVDSDGDGQADYTLANEYDEDGRILSQQQDNNGDGQADYILSYTYDEHNRLLNQQQDSNGDGQAEFVVSYQYRDPADMTDDVASPNIGISDLPISNNELTRQEIDRDGDGQADDIATYQYNDQGWMTRYEHDSDGDGQLDTAINYGYDDLGRMTLVETDANGNGIFELIERAEFNEAGTKIRSEKEFDDNGDEVIDILSVATFDAFGQQILGQADTDLDGVFDSTSTSEYDEQGNNTLYKYNSDTYNVAQYYTYNDLNQRIVGETDHNDDGIINVIDYTTYDDMGFVNGQSHDYDADGVIDSFHTEVIIITENSLTRTEHYNEEGLLRSEEREKNDDGNLIRVSKDSDGDGEFDEESFNVFDENNIFSSEDHNGDGIIDSITNLSHDNNGKLISIKKDFDVDGILDEIISYTYDDAGNQSSYKLEIDSNDDGQIDYSQTRQYNAEGDVVLVGTYGSNDQSGYDIA